MGRCPLWVNLDTVGRGDAAIHVRYASNSDKRPRGPAVGYGPHRTIYLTGIDANGKVFCCCCATACGLAAVMAANTASRPKHMLVLLIVSPSILGGKTSQFAPNEKCSPVARTPKFLM